MSAIETLCKQPALKPWEIFFQSKANNVYAQDGRVRNAFPDHRRGPCPTRESCWTPSGRRRNIMYDDDDDDE